MNNDCDEDDDNAVNNEIDNNNDNAEAGDTDEIKEAGEKMKLVRMTFW